MDEDYINHLTILQEASELLYFANKYSYLAFGLLYQECFYRLHRNFKLSAQNRNPKVTGMDIAFEEGFIYDMLAIARKVLGDVNFLARCNLDSPVLSI